MGLAISRSIIEEHGEHLEITRLDEEGMVMTLTLPAVE